ncbi:GNAT family N-acetyltransferase [Georgenia sp. TF02-10]|uniref:GNAT family N-acetyltransferase n=1 Tax=Georgenia sp. TF02-10 TaxID=2917725 RepID=UPI001FA6F2C5|nr:GNAT family N-acetyltransferase [Georgenia sp. TF02-10]UNX54531.1 GNAT family N-acetyltransferase [Georgenia sp. TF02-10]
MITETSEVGPWAGEVLALAAAAEQADGVAALSEQTLLDLRHPGRPVRHLLARVAHDPHPDPARAHAGVDGAARDEEEGAVVGYAQVQPPAEGGAASAELVVHPAGRRRGVGRALLEAVRLRGDVAVWAHGNLPAARALAVAAGLTQVRELLQMARDLPPAGAGGDGADAAATNDAGDAAGTVGTAAAGADTAAGAAGSAGVPAPDALAALGARPGYAVAPFVPGRDEEAWVRLNARAFADHPEQGRMTVADLRARQAEDWFDPSLLWLVRPAGTPDTGPVASMWVKAEPGADEGEIYALGVDPSAQGQGLGGALTRLALAEMARRGLGRATLYVEGDNAAARRTYEREGFRPLRSDVQYR